MLNIQTKLNRFDAPTVFNLNQNDAAEFNSATSEIKNAVVDQGGILTPAAVPDYLTDDPHQLNKSIIAGGGWIMPTDSVTDSLVTFTAAAAGAGNFPPIAQFQDKFLRFSTSANPNTGAYEVDYGVEPTSDLLDLSGNPLPAGQLPASVVAEIFFDGNNWRLNNTYSTFADAISYTPVQGDLSTDSGTVTISPSPGFFKWHLSGTKIQVSWTIRLELTVAASAFIELDLSNAGLPSGAWAGVSGSAVDTFFTGAYIMVGDLTRLFIRTPDGSDIPTGDHDWGGSFFWEFK